MRSSRLRLAALAVVLAAGTGTAHAQSTPGGTVQWGPAPAVFPAGAELAVLQGDPSKPEVFTVRLRFPDGYVIPAHRHPTDEHITIITGSLGVGMGDVFSEEKLTFLVEGDFITAQGGMNHYARARGATVVQVHAVGPFQLTYVDPAMDPTK